MAHFIFLIPHQTFDFIYDYYQKGFKNEKCAIFQYDVAHMCATMPTIVGLYGLLITKGSTQIFFFRQYNCRTEKRGRQ